MFTVMDYQSLASFLSLFKLIFKTAEINENKCLSGR